MRCAYGRAHHMQATPTDDVVQPGVGQSLFVTFTKSSLRTPLPVRTAPQTAVSVAQALGAPSTSRWTRIMAGMEHDTHSKPAIRHHVATAVHKGVGARGRFHCERAAPAVARGGNCSSAMDSSVQQRLVALVRRNEEES